MLSNQLSRQSIRQSIRQRRNQLTQAQQKDAAEKLLCQYSKHSNFPQAQTIAVYLSFDGELNTQPLINWLWKKNKTVALPILHPFSKGHLLFIKYDKTTELYPNQYNILEPKLDKTKVIPFTSLDIILTPLVAFDKKGNRLGMGGGYYDRTLTHLNSYSNNLSQKQTTAVGLAHDCQQVNTLPTESWDIPLTSIITPSKIWQW